MSGLGNTANPGHANPDEEPDVPSWVVLPATTTAPLAPLATVGPVPRPLLAVAVLTTGIAALETSHVVARDELVPGLRAFLVLVIAVQVLLAVLTARRSAGAALGLLVCQVATILGAVNGGFGQLRAVLAIGAVAVVVLVSVSLKTFPAPRLPPLEHRM